MTDDEIHAPAATAKPCSLALLRRGRERTMDGADAIEREHRRRTVSLRAEGVIVILCPVASDTVSGVAITAVTAAEAEQVMAGDPRVRAGTMTYEVHLCPGFPGDSLPNRTTSGATDGLSRRPSVPHVRS
uniref:hypothetical protein n=1 Tax=Streptomyces polyasparticus TaxID=2767826 RepID=UPI001F254BEB|nr:hypothetical protein [Streptomyces polyasparticus]